MGEFEHRSEGQLMAAEKWGFLSNNLNRVPSTDALRYVRIRRWNCGICAGIGSMHAAIKDACLKESKGSGSNTRPFMATLS